MTSDSTPLVSVVTPVFNGEPYLRECIESVRAQTFTNWDYTIVDNCSTDRTLAIACEYAARDGRIRVIRNDTFVRVSQNYNIALRQISPASKYCKPLAADDCLLPECLDKMLRVAEEHPNVAIVGAYSVRGTAVVWEGPPYPQNVVSGREICRMKFLRGLYAFGTPTTLLLRSSIVRSRHAFYSESNLHCDAEACLEFLEHHDFGFVHQILTSSRPAEEGSLTSLSRRLNTYQAGDLHELVKYGPVYLSEQELAPMIRQCLRDYYRYLGKEVFKRREREFWRYHRTKLEELGYPLSTFRLAAGAAAFLIDALLNPKQSLEKGLQRTVAAPQSQALAGPASK